MRSNLNQCLRHLAMVALLLTGFAQAEDTKGPSPEMLAKISKANDACFACHSAEGVKNPPKQGMDLKNLRGLIRDRDTFHSSDHQRLACTKCHNEGYDDHPHAKDAKDSTSTCSDCHDKKATRIEKQFEKSVHAKNLSDSFACTTCHDPHRMRVAEKLIDPKKIVAQDNRVCLSCHDSDEKFARYAPDKKARPLIDDIHDWLPNTRLHWKSIRCVECHTPAVAAGEPMSHEIVNKEKAEKKCVSCHTGDRAHKTRLYRHLAKDEQQKYGFLNSVVLSNAYVIGATRNPTLDFLMITLAVLTLGGVLIHAILRVIAARLRRSKQHD